MYRKQPQAEETLMKQLYTLFFLILIANTSLRAQQITQTIRGVVIDRESNAQIEGVSVVVLKDSGIVAGAVTDASGSFRLEKVPVGRINLSASYIGYKKVYQPNILVNSGKELVMNIEMDAAVETKNEVVISGIKKGESINEMAQLSVRSFSPEETERYAGSRGDPARMASNYAGVSGSDDSQNQLVVRGNSPFGILYRVDNVVIPNPNHFAGEGQTAGSVAILTDRMLTNSDFFTGAFPAEYGDAIAGVFDIRMKNGNNERHEFTMQLGVLGAEIFGEGPLGKDTKASYIFNARYATLDALVKMGIDIGTTAIPKYQDLQFKFNFPLKNGDNISFFAIGGYAMINFITSNIKRPGGQDIYASTDQDEYYRSGMGVAGLTYLHRINNHEYSKVSVAVSTQYGHDNFTRIIRHADPVTGNYVIDTTYHKEDYTFASLRYTLSYMRNNKLSARSSIRYGVTTEMLQPNYNYRILEEPAYNVGLTHFYWDTTLNAHSQFHFMIQPYFQWKYTVNEKLSMVLGAHGQYFTMTNSWSLEPRFSMKWQFKPNQSLSFGTGIYSQMLPFYQYFVQDTAGRQANKHLDFIRSYHVVLGYDVFFKHDVRIKFEAYFQQLWNLPVDTFPSSYNMLDEGTGFNLFFAKKQVNKGLGRNYGVEFTLEKFFTHNWFLLFTASGYDSKLQGSNGKYYNSDYNGNYIINLLGTKEFRWQSKKRLNTIGIGGKISFAGGLRYTPFDTTLSKLQENAVVVDSLRNKFQFQPYFRFDIKLNYRCNSKRFTHEVGIDLVNVTGQKNILRVQYVNPQNPAQKVYQLGFLPLFYYRLDFWLGKKNW